VSGSRAHALIEADFFAGELLRAEAPAATSPTTRTPVNAAIARRREFFTCDSFTCCWETLLPRFRRQDKQEVRSYN
jgi:hypothetical protein